MFKDSFGSEDNFDISDVNQKDPQFNGTTSEKLKTCFSDWTKETSTEMENDPDSTSKVNHEMSPQQDDECNLDDQFNLDFTDADNAAISKMLEPDNIEVSMKNNSIAKVDESKNRKFCNVNNIYQNTSPLDQSTNETQEKSYFNINNAELELHMKSNGLCEFMTDIEWEPIWERFQAEPNDEDKKIDQKFVDIEKNHNDEKMNDRSTKKARTE